MGAVLWCVETLRFFKVPLCVGPVLWCVRALNFQSSLGVGVVLWCVKTLSFKVPMCVGSMLWRVRTLSFQSSPVCGPCAVVCGDYDIFHKVPALCCGV